MQPQSIFTMTTCLRVLCGLHFYDPRESGRSVVSFWKTQGADSSLSIEHAYANYLEGSAFRPNTVGG